MKRKGDDEEEDDEEEEEEEEEDEDKGEQKGQRPLECFSESWTLSDGFF